MNQSLASGLSWTTWAGVLFGAVACGSDGGADPCESVCDGIARCREGNAMCVAEGMTAREPFMTTCVAQCEMSAGLLDAAGEAEALQCVDCLSAQTNFEMCLGEMLLDETCATTCRSPGAIIFRDDFGPAIYDQFSCLRNPP